MTRNPPRSPFRPARPAARPFLAIAACLAALLHPSAAPGRAAEPKIPAPAGYVTDAAGVMGDSAAKTEELCRTIERKTTAEVAVLTVATTGGIPVEEFARMVYDRWKIGKKGKDNGVLVLVAVSDRRMFVATGYGVEGVLPDGKVGEIRDRYMMPSFRQGNYGEGILFGVHAIGNVLSGGTLGSPARVAPPKRKIPLAGIVLLLLILLLVGPWFFLGPFGAGRRGRDGGFHGGFGGGGFGGGGFGGFGGGGFGGFGGGGFGGGGAGGGW